MKFKLFTAISIIAMTISQASFIHAAGTVNWGYYQHGATPVVLPDKWGDYFPLCNGMKQSPIDLQNSVKAELDELDFNDKKTPLTILNNGHTIQIDYKPGSNVTIGKQQYQLLQFHFHTPSENWLNGNSYPMEMHLVHVNTSGELAVIAVFIKEGEKNKAFEKIITNAPLHEGTVTTSQSINVKKLLPKKLGKFFNFTGSLTTPPCSEGVRWYVMDKPIQFSAKQIREFEHIMHVNARPIQQLSARVIYKNKH